MLDKEITELLEYAQSHLMLDELDKAQAVRRIVRLLRLDGFTPIDSENEDGVVVENHGNPDSLLLPLINSAVERGVIAESERKTLKAEIMDALMLKPSEVNDLFADTHSVNVSKAFDFLYDYNVKGGYVDLAECAKSDRWEAKELKSHIEVIINVMPQATVNGYPECSLCYENIGIGENANRRSVEVELGGEEWFFTYSRHQYFDRHAVIANKTHTAPTDDINTLHKLADAATFVGNDGFVGTNEAIEGGGAKNRTHEHFQVGFWSAPALKAPTLARYKSKEYPYVELTTVDWYNTIVRMSHSSIDKLVEFVDKFITAWKSYSDERIVNPDGDKNFVNVIVRRNKEKYVFDVVLRSNGLKKPRTAPEYAEIKAEALSLNDVLGYIVLPEKLSEKLQKVQLYLDGTTPFDKANLSEDMKGFGGMIERMLKAQGGTVSKLEAKLNVHDEVDIACEKILASTAVFNKDHSIMDFFDTLDITNW